MLFAITDIETTGSAPAGSAITEIAICLHDGNRVIREFQTLLDPGVRLPSFITALTGITDDMLVGAPVFGDVVDELFGLLDDAVFVAHNVNFDYSFLKAAFDEHGYTWRPKKLCTVRLARRAFPGLRRYGLEHLCRELSIVNTAAHRAMGDTRATVQVFEQCLDQLGTEEIHKMVARGNADAFLPNNVPAEEFLRLPERPGVYYLMDASGKPIYIGKAINLRKRVRDHFRPNGSARHQAFIREICHIDFTETGNELIALLLEDAEIRRHWPAHNAAQKKKADVWAVLDYTDQRGYLRLAVQRSSAHTPAIRTFATAQAARLWVSALAEEHGLQPRLLGSGVFSRDDLPEADSHNAALSRAIAAALGNGEAIAFYSHGRTPGETAFVLVEDGRLRGYGFLPPDEQADQPGHLEAFLTPLPTSPTSSGIVRSFSENPRGMRVMRWQTSGLVPS